MRGCFFNRGCSPIYLTIFLIFIGVPMFISSAIAQTAPAAAPGGDGIMGSLQGMLPLVLMFVVLYFVMIRPQMKRQKETKAMLDALVKGDEVSTTGGIIGTITQINDSIVTLEVAAGVEIQVQRFAVAQVLPKGTRA
jgi:preprotein translocase subunit YajC